MSREGSARSAAAVGYPVLGVACFLFAWWAWIEFAVTPGGFLAAFAPDRAFRALAELMRDGVFPRHIVASVSRILVGLAIAAVLGIPLGLALGLWPALRRTVNPVASFIRMVSPLSWTPLAIIWFGVGDQPVYFLIAIGAIWPISISTSAGIAAIDPQWLVLGRSLGANRVELLWTVIWPGIRANVLTGLRLALTTAWIILVPAEMLGVDSGLGYFILDSRDRFAYDDLVAAIIVIGVIGIVLDGIAQLGLTPRRRRGRSTAAGATGKPARLLTE